MAEAPDVTEKGLHELEEEITCPVCQEYFRDPKVLPCCHYYCAECIRQIALRKRPFPCPECRKDTALPQNDPNQLPPAFFVNRLIELHAKMEKVQGKVEAMCEMCSGAKATAFCRQCTDFICDDCVKSHRKLRVFAGHEIATLQELKEGGAKRIALKEALPIACKQHDEPVKIFCFDCNRLICRDCIIIDHAGHKYEFVKKAAPQCKEKLSESVAPLRKIRDDIASATKEVQSAEAEIRAQGTQNADSINQAFLQLFEILKRRQQELLKKSSTLVQQKLDKLSVQEKNFQLTTTMVQSLIEFVEQNLENATNEELMSVHEQILTRAEEERQKHGNLDLEVTEEADVTATISCADALTKICQEKADVRTYNVTAEGPGLKRPEINKPTRVVVHTRGKLSAKQRVVEAELKSLVDGSVTRMKGTLKSRGTYELTYTPMIRGRHCLSITVNGQPVAGSPFPVFVRIHPTQLGKPVRVIPGLEHPLGIAISSDDHLYITTGEEVYVMDRNGRKLKSIGSPKLNNPFGVAFDKHGDVFVTDWSSHSLLKFDKSGKLLKVIKRYGSQPGQFTKPGGVTVVGDRVLVCDRYTNSRVQIFTTDLNFVHSFGSKGDKDGQFDQPNYLVQDQAGNLFVTDCGNHRIQVFDGKGRFLYTFGKKGTMPGLLQQPLGLAFDSDRFLYVAERENNRISVFQANGQFVVSFGRSGGELKYPNGIALDHDGFVYVCNYGHDRIQVF